MKRKLLCLLLALGLLLGDLPAVSAASDSGTWGKNITWTFDAGTGRLTITGSGEMMYENSSPNWLRHKSEIRSAVVGEGITNLCAYAFNGCEQLTGVSLPASLREIDHRAFAECASLASVALPAGLYDIGADAFLNCAKLGAIDLPRGLAYIGEKAFFGCTGLTAIDVPGSVRALGGRFLAGCRNLRTVTLHPGLEVIGKEAFWGLCAETLTLPDTVWRLENGALSSTLLRSITLSSRLREIEANAFANCPNLTSLTLPASVEYVGRDAFSSTPVKTLVVRNPECSFSYDPNNVAGIAGLFGYNETDVYGYPGSSVQKILERFPDSQYTFKPLYFDDVAPGVWYYDAVSFAREHSLFQGVGTRSFAPELAMSRGMVVQVLYNLAGDGAECANPFTDVPAGAWYAKAVCWAAEEGVVNGMGDGRFAAEAPVTREQFAVIMQRFTRRLGIDAGGGADLSAFPDASQVSAWAAEAMGWAVGGGILTGSAVNGKNYLRPGATATRAQVAAIMMRCLNLWDLSTHTDLCIGLVYPRNLTAAFEQAAADYTARHPEVRIRFVNADVMTYDTALDFSEADALLWLDESVREKYAAGQTAAVPVLRSPYVLMIRPNLPGDPATTEEIAALLREKKYALGAPAFSPARTYCADLLAGYGLDSGDIPWQWEQTLEEVAFHISFGLLDMGVGTECLARKERLWIPADSTLEGRGETLYGYYPEASPKKDALLDFFAELRAGQFDALFAPLGLYPVE